MADGITRYIDACDKARTEVGKMLSDLSETLCETGHLPAITQASHINLILTTVVNHASSANKAGWNMAKISEKETCAARFNDLWPYWMDREDAVKNTFELNGLFLLTAPNMSGKSTLMRSAACAALLTNCGLCAPVGINTVVRQFDSIFLRGASSDIPSENKSAL